MIKVEHLTKYYGDFPAVEDLSFEIGEKSVCGFLGPNGAGKSTTMNIIAGCLSSTGGTVKVGGHDIYEEPEEAKKLIGYLPEQPPLYVNETPEEYLRFVGEARGLRGRELEVQIRRAMNRAGITEVRNRLIRNLSKGYRQRVGIAQALLGEPAVIILDEPTVGLDPIQIVEIRDLIRRLGREHAVIFSSHILSEVQTICDRVLIIAGGKLVADDTPDHLEEHLTRQGSVCFRTDADVRATREILEGTEGLTGFSCEETEDGTTRAEVTTDSDDVRAVCRSLFFAFAEKGEAIFEMSSQKANLEEVFLELTEGSTEEGTAEEGSTESGPEPEEEPAGETESEVESE